MVSLLFAFLLLHAGGGNGTRKRKEKDRPMNVPKGFINAERLENVLEELQELLFVKYHLTPLERDIVLKIGLRQEAKMQHSKEMRKGLQASKNAAADLMKRAGFV